jgi:hypothetical protein
LKISVLTGKNLALALMTTNGTLTEVPQFTSCSENKSWQYVSSTNNFSFNYEIGISFGLCQICWVSGPWQGPACDQQSQNPVV